MGGFPLVKIRPGVKQGTRLGAKGDLDGLDLPSCSRACRRPVWRCLACSSLGNSDERVPGASLVASGAPPQPTGAGARAGRVFERQPF